MKTLLAIPVYNEAATVGRVLEEVLGRCATCGHQPAADVLVVDDGSTDATTSILARHAVNVLRHHTNLGYGRSLIDAFAYAHGRGYEWCVTMDCDEQHEPAMIPAFLAAIERDDADIISGSRYLASIDESTRPPADRRAINATLTREINERLRFDPPLTDAFCGFKAHRVDAMMKLGLTEPGYAFPMQLWARAAAAGLRVRELPVKLIYKDLARSFPGTLRDPDARLAHYRAVLDREINEPGASATRPHKEHVMPETTFHAPVRKEISGKSGQP